MDAERPRFIGSRGNYAAALRVSADDYRLSLQLRVKRLLHRNEEGIQINIEDTASHKAAYKLAHRADKANLLVGFLIQLLVGLLSNLSSECDLCFDIPHLFARTVLLGKDLEF